MNSNELATDRFETRVEMYLEFAQARAAAGYTLTVETGRRYVKIVKTVGSSRSVFGFIDTVNGDLLKAATFKAPSAGARGNLYDSSTWAKCTGPHSIG